MALNPQIHPFPPIHQSEQSWDHSLRALAQRMFPGGRIGNGLKLGIPATTGLLPTLTDGYINSGDKVIGPFGARLISTAPASATRGLYYGSKQMRYLAAADADPSDILIGTVVTDADSIVSVVQTFYPAPGKVVVRALLNLPKVTAGADVSLGTVTLEGYAGFRVAHAHTKTAEVAATTAGGDDVVIKHGSTTLVTHNQAALDSATGLAIASPGATEVSPDSNSVELFYNSTQGTAFTAGMVEAYVEVEGLV
ncbi:hypothetical protein [Leptothoe spongobia]|uniref:Uncharacterized protein n=1 Tax=Leptothoe spongobia TAU-MAC 1115 TaxID=1967444 RepID=A0A947GJ64_9CYAN|nr:hypothetical protein [Leptothoe spongobia]MBT9316299.1 hypothetical protein [Leptothoe spongobia TAU-MAC 1115]